MHDTNSVLKCHFIYLKSKGPYESVSKARLAGTWAFIDAFIKRVDSSSCRGVVKWEKAEGL